MDEVSRNLLFAVTAVILSGTLIVFIVQYFRGGFGRRDDED